MSRKLLQVEHHLASGCCMWSGIEDVYASKTKQSVPEAFLFGLSSFGESAFIHTGDPKRPYMFGACDGRTRITYDRIKDLIGLEYHISEGRTLQYALRSIKKEIDEGRPVILGPLDMYYLPYLKMYHKDHIPMHYIMMVGYDEEKECCLIYDCDREGLIEYPQEELIRAWQIETNDVGKKNGFIRFSLSEQLPSAYDLTDISLKRKVERQLCTKPSFMGVNAYEKMAREILTWREMYEPEKYREILASFTEFFCMVPKLPNAILGISETDGYSYRGNYDRWSKILLQMGEKNDREDWVRASALFQECGENIEKITDIIIQFYCQQGDTISKLPDLFRRNGELAKKAYQILAEN